MLVGFKKATIQILDDKMKPVEGKKYVIQGTANQGATSSFEISGLTSEAVKVYGSDVPYYVLQQGTGDVDVKVSMLDLPPEVENEVLGIKAGDDKIYHIGEDTIAPYCAVLFESSNFKGEKIGIGFYAGKFGRDGLKAETKTDENKEPEADEYSFKPIAKDVKGKSQTVGLAYETTSFEALETEVLGSK